MPLRPVPTRNAAGLPRADQVTTGDRLRRKAFRTRGRILCLAGLHPWAHLRNPEVGGARAHYDLCRRCGRERSAYLPLNDAFGR